MSGAIINNRYEVVSALGSGADGQVWLVEDHDNDHALRALKLVGDLDEGRRQRLVAEFRRLAALDHARLVGVHDLEQIDVGGDFPRGTLFFTSDYIAGRDASAGIDELDDQLAAIITIAEDIAAALAHIHAAGLVHCDVKPANIILDTRGGAVLLDLGLSAARGASGQIRGTPEFMSPEALAGCPDASADLYSLGASLYRIVAGTAPFSGGDVRELVRAICSQEPRPVADLAPWLPAEVAALIMQLCKSAPGDRHSSAAVVVADLARIREALNLPARHLAVTASLTPPRLVARASQLAALCQGLRQPPSPALIGVCGATGVGRRALVAAARRRHQIAVAAGDAHAVDFISGDVDRVDRLLGSRSPAPAPAQRRSKEQWVDGFIEKVAAAPRPLVVILSGDEDERSRALLRAVAAGAVADDKLVIIALVDPGRAQDIDLPLVVDVTPLSRSDVGELAESMLARPLPEAWVDELHRVSAGLPRYVVEVVRAAALSSSDVVATSPTELLAGGDASALAELVVARAAALAPAHAAVVEALAVHGGSATLEAISATVDQAITELAAITASLAAGGFLVWERDRPELPSAIHAEAVHQAIPSARRKALHRRALSWHESRPERDVVACARHLVVTGPAKRAAATCYDAALIMLGRGQPDAAIALARTAATLGVGTAAADANVTVAEIALDIGEYDEAENAAGRAARSRDRDRRRRALLALARVKHKRGELDDAAGVYARLLDERHSDEVAGPYARLLVALGRYPEAAALAARDSLASPLSPGAAMCLESAGLAALYTGELEGARDSFARLEREARESSNRALIGRALGLSGMVAQAEGRIARAAHLYADAAVEARAAGDIHAAAVYDLNQATAHSERGRHGAALEALASAVVQLRRLGDVPELAAALYNRGVALLALGEISAARHATEESSTHARARDTPHMQLYARLLDAEVSRREGALSRAAAAYRDVLARAESSRERLVANLNLAEVLSENHDPLALEVLATAASEASSVEDQDRLAITRARVALARGDDGADLGPELDAAGRRMRDGGRLDQAWRCAVVAARIARAAGDDARAAELVASAGTIRDEIIAATPETHRPGLAADPDGISLAALASDLAATDSPPPPPLTEQPASHSERHLRRLLALGRRLNSELRLAPLLDQVIDTVIEMTAAERGFLLLSDPGDRGALTVVVARNFEQSPLEGEELRVSRSIAERAARTGEVVLTIDAAFDERWGTAESVAAMRLRSVLAVPLRQKGRITGTIYVDHRFRAAAFDDEAIELVRELADFAAVAIENARLVEDNRRREREISALNQRLEAEVIEKEAELATVKSRLASDPRAELRHPYDAIVGRSPAMLTMLRELDRATETELPVVVNGDSGTGKELVARALHHNGSRRDQPFVAINCGALPEQLLESELFGHIRGAFTGANRDRRGLFEVADHGTLFLDEIADTSLAMQSRLLRVLQEGELRRVGDERHRKVDVRIIAATNRELGALVADGSFREDLYYRLNVLNIVVPALRERVEDIAALAEHILAGLGQPPAALTRASLSRLCAYSWPGNVRELENELARASALAGDTIDVGDLSPRFHNVTRPPAPVTRDNLDIKEHVEALERALVEEALERTGGNQTAAARLLGLSRYGLQKKLKRYGISRSRPAPRGA